MRCPVFFLRVKKEKYILVYYRYLCYHESISRRTVFSRIHSAGYFLLFIRLVFRVDFSYRVVLKTETGREGCQCSIKKGHSCKRKRQCIILEEELKQVYRLSGSGVAESEIARQCGITVEQVKEILE